MNLIEPTKHEISCEFETQRLLVRRYKPTDVAALYEAAKESVADMNPFLPWCHADYSISEAEQWIALTTDSWGVNNHFGFVIEEKSSQRFVGGIGVNAIDSHPMVNLGYWLRSSATGKGYASEAAKGMIKWSFEELKTQRIEIILSVKNASSKKVAESTGANFEATLANRLVLHGRPHDAYLFAMTQGAYLETHSVKEREN